MLENGKIQDAKGALKMSTPNLREAAQKMSDALELFGPEPWEPWDHNGVEIGASMDVAIADLRAALALPDEPVLWRYKDSESVVGAMAGYKPGKGWTPLYAAPQSAPVERKPLTDEEIDAIMNPLTTVQYSWRAFARAIEHAHGIKAPA